MLGQPQSMNKIERQRLLDWWNTMEAARPMVRKLMSLTTELRLHPNSSHADGMILFYRAASEVSYGYAGVRGCIRRAFTNEYAEPLRLNMVKCHSFAERFSVDMKVLLERVSQQISDPEALNIVQRLREILAENDEWLKEIKQRADAFFGKETFHTLQQKVQEAVTLPNNRKRTDA
ncbi:hypothetical protein [Heyndrickxia camelliae]|uniref:Uncharacterized protein n=1 Tax=Heyndrickxia camelliae TaxID=1707093 RepID=A0A2N3LIZ4_9BACI|nr:hypothetical protein [Heyndrickxia camelliae]PKR84544.1 hypothetical protein CWO92_12575 [Heyndrickxia camelliae]